MQEVYDEIKSKITLDNKEAYDEFIRILKEKNLDTKEKVIEYTLKKTDDDKYYPGTSILLSFFSEFKIQFYEELRKHKQEGNEDFIESFIYYLYLCKIFDKKRLKEMAVGSMDISLEERVNLIDRGLSNFYFTIYDEHINYYSKRLDNVRNAKTLPEKIWHIIEMEYFFNSRPSFMDFEYEYILLDKFPNMSQAPEVDYDD